MNGLTAAAIFSAGVVAGVVNTVVGSGTLLSFPVLLAVGYPPLVANMSNTVGLAPGNFSGAYGYRHELNGQGPRILRFGAVALLGGVAGAVLLLVLPAGVFARIIPALIAVGALLVLFQPRLKRALDRRRAARPVSAASGFPLYVGIFGCGVYGGYFGAAAGVIMLALFGVFLADDLQRLNAVKNVCVGLINGVAAVMFIIVGHVAWVPAGLLAAGSIVGGQFGAKIGLRLSPTVLRVSIVVVGLTASVILLVK